MAMEKWNNSPPQNLIILACAVGAAITLFTLKFGFDSYYDGMRDRQVALNETTFDDTAQLHEARAEWQQALESGNPMPVSEAMSQLASRGRNGFPQIRPAAQAEINTRALEGWNQLPQEVHVPTLEERGAGAQAPTPGGISPDAMRQLQEAVRRALEQRAAGGAPVVVPAPTGAQ